jgi:hypothetical protein
VAIADYDSIKGFKPRTIAEAQVFCNLADRWQVFRECLTRIEMYVQARSLIGRSIAEKVCEAGLEATEKLPALIAEMFDAILWILCSGAPWRDLPRRYGPWQSAYHWYASGRTTAPSTASWSDSRSG